MAVVVVFSLFVIKQLGSAAVECREVKHGTIPLMEVDATRMQLLRGGERVSAVVE